MQYDVVRNSDLDELSERVEDLSLDGWRPQGGVTAVIIGGEPVYLQAVVRDEDEGDEEDEEPED